MLSIRIHTGDAKSLIDPPPADLARYRADPGAFIWVDLEEPTHEELAAVAPVFGILDLTVEDLLVQGQRAKLEAFDGYNVLIMHGMNFDPATREVSTPEVDIVLGKNFLITGHPPSLRPIIHDPQGPGHACAQLGKSPTLLLYGIVDRLVDSYYPVLDTIDDAIESVEEQVLGGPTSDVLGHIFTLKHSLSTLRKVISPQLELFNRLIAREDDIIDHAYVVYFRDIYDHLVRSFEVVDSYRDLMSSSMDAYLSMVANRQNELIQRLTLFATIFMPITFLTGLFGQNFRDMPQVDHDNGYLWWYVLGFMVLLSVGQVFYYRRRHWL
jgi:magnesium transporter